jgi:RNA polymerase sigma factor (sigma-70 family)
MEQTLAAPAREAPEAADLAFEDLYRSSRDDMFAYAVGLLRDRAAAEDVTATAFERAFRKRRHFDPDRGSARAWLFGIARNAALDELRRRRRQATLTADPEDVDSPAQASVAEQGAKRAAIRLALARLEPAERELVALKFFAGLTNAEIAHIVGVSESNAGTRLHRVITKLREACQ